MMGLCSSDIACGCTASANQRTSMAAIWQSSVAGGSMLMRRALPKARSSMGAGAPQLPCLMGAR
jgi:hypothetical protein